jgi:hypothetical protein
MSSRLNDSIGLLAPLRKESKKRKEMKNTITRIIRVSVQGVSSPIRPLQNHL